MSSFPIFGFQDREIHTTDFDFDSLNTKDTQMAPHRTFDEAEEIIVCRGDIDYQGIVKHINDGVVIIREGKIVFANDAFNEISGKGTSEVLETEFSSFVAETDRNKVVDYCTRRLYTDDLSDTIEFIMPGIRGDAIIEMKVSVVECSGSPAILGALTDITERRKTRIELQRLKERFESIIHSMNEVVVSLSPSDYSIRAVNPAAEALYGIPLRDFTSGERHITDFVHRKDKEKVDRFYKGMPEAEFDQAQYRIVSAANEVKWVLDEGHVVYASNGTIRRIDHVIRDITEEKNATDALTQSEAKYRDFFESTSDMAFSISPDGTFIDINKAGLKLLGLESKEEALSSNVKEFYVDPAEREELVEEIYGVGYVEGKPVKFRNRNGDVIEVAITSRAKMDGSGNHLYHEGIVHNISQAMETQRTKVLRNAAGGMCHYLNTHLMQLSGSYQALEEEMESFSAVVDLIAEKGEAREFVPEMRRLLDSMRFFSKGVAGAYSKISEVTRAFNKAFIYREESYLNSTILDIFKSCGYDAEEVEKQEKGGN